MPAGRRRVREPEAARQRGEAATPRERSERAEGECFYQLQPLAVGGLSKRNRLRLRNTHSVATSVARSGENLGDKTQK